MSGSVKVLDASSFSQLSQTSNDLYLIDFWAEWCGPCRAMAPYFERASTLEKYQDVLQFAKINTDENQELAMKFNITGIPCFIFIQFDSQTGQAIEKERIVGGAEYIKFIDIIDEKLKSLKK